jgi:hypothetical protein
MHLAARRPGPHSRLARKRRRGQLARLLFGALVVAFLTGSTSHRMHLAMKTEQQEGGGSAGEGSGSSSALAGLRSWLSAGASERRSLREGGPAGSAAQQPTGGGAGARAVQIYDHWWMLGGCRPPVCPGVCVAAAASAADASAVCPHVLSGAARRSRQPAAAPGPPCLLGLLVAGGCCCRREPRCCRRSGAAGCVSPNSTACPPD